MGWLRTRLQRWTTPLALFGAALLSYGLWIPWMGLFGNDLPYLYYFHLLGPWGPGLFASVDRPVSALFYAASTFLLGEAVWPYHVLLLLLRWLSGLLLWWVLGLVWPERRRAAALAGFLFVLYPGFRQNPVALEFILHFFVLDLFLLSLGTTLLAACAPPRERSAALPARRFWTLTTITLLGTSGLFFLEYFAGLEILRPVFLWIVTRRAGLRGKMQWQRIGLSWLPALIVSLAFFIWRMFLSSVHTYQPVLLESLRSAPLTGLVSLARRVLADVWTASGRAWMQTLQWPSGSRSLLIYLSVAVIGAALAVLIYQSGKAEEQDPSGAHYGGESLLGIGLLAMLAGGSIFWVTDIPVTLSFPWDRSTLSFMLGASLALVGLLEMVVQPRYRGVLVAGLAALAIGMHFVNALEYRAEWQKLQDFAWQLTWRAPQLEPGTLVLFDVLPLDRYSDNDLTALANWIYAPDLHVPQVPYKFFDLNLRLSEERAGLPGIAKGLAVNITHRGLEFRGNTSNTLALIYNPPGCLKIFAPQDLSAPELTDKLKRVLPITRLEQVRVGAAASARPPAQLGAEPPHGWCYYFQKADLARQREDWAAISALGDQAEEAGLHAGMPSELLPFIEGYAMAGHLDQARNLSETAGKQAALQPALCALWGRLQSRSIAAQAAAAVQNQLGCKP